MTKRGLRWLRVGLIAGVVVAFGFVLGVALRSLTPSSAEAKVPAELPGGIAKGLRDHGIFARDATPVDLGARTPVQAERALRVATAHIVIPADETPMPYLVVFTDTTQGRIRPDGEGPITNLIYQDRLAWLVYVDHFQYTPHGTLNHQPSPYDAELAVFVDAPTGERLFFVGWGTTE